MIMPYAEGNITITSVYGERSDGFHRGIDMVGENKSIVSVTDGTVVRSRCVTDRGDTTSEWGEYIAVLDSESGCICYYCHLSKRYVKLGDKVVKGAIIGAEGSTGKSSGSHLHFEVRIGSKAIDPAAFLSIPNKVGSIIKNPLSKQSTIEEDMKECLDLLMNAYNKYKKMIKMED